MNETKLNTNQRIMQILTNKIADFNGIQKSSGYATKLLAATHTKLTESSTMLAQIFELISAQKTVQNFSQTKLREAISYYTGFSVVCDLLLGVLSVAQTIQFASTAMEIDVPTYLNLLKRVHNAREFKMKWIQKGLEAYGAAVTGVFEASIEENKIARFLVGFIGSTNL